MARLSVEWVGVWLVLVLGTGCYSVSQQNAPESDAGGTSGGNSGTGASSSSGGNVGGDAGSSAGGVQASSGGTAGNGGTTGQEPDRGPSCSGEPGAGMTCGASPVDCCATLFVPGGSYKRSYDGVYNLADSHPATVSSFYLDKFEVTVGRFRTFLGEGWSIQTNPPPAGAGGHPKIADSGWKASWTTNLPADLTGAVEARACDYRSTYRGDFSYEHHPMPCVSWFEAFAFCAWDGGRLPTEAEWNYAAAGGEEQRVFPWSSPANSAVILSVNAVYDWNEQASVTGNPDFLAVGMKPAGMAKWSHLDLSGNLAEWVLDRVDDYSSACDDCANLDSADSSRVFRGGDFATSGEGMTAGSRVSINPGTRSIGIGFRCARD